LNTLLDPLSGWSLSVATAINDAGQIVGAGMLEGQTHAFLLTPVPEPSAFLLIAMAATALIPLAQHRRRRGR
jgi:hypothetical protein